MTKRLLLLACCVFAIAHAEAQKYFGQDRLCTLTERHEHAAFSCEDGLQGTGVDAFSFVPPPADFQFGAARDVSIVVNYSGFPANAQAAFQYAVDIWASNLTSTVPIQVNATWTNIGGNTLGFASAEGFYRNFPNAPLTNTYYPAALADKLRESNNAPGSVDISCSFNSSSNWYFGTDGNTPSGQYDFVTVVLHELCHGLGFLGSASVSGGQESLGFNGSDFIYDVFVEQQSGALLTALPNGSTALGDALTGNQLYWGGDLGIAANAGTRPRLYAPGTWAGGSSYSHLNENTYPSGNVNSLMTPFIGTAEANHDPGPIVYGMFEDMGWTLGGCGFISATAGSQTPCIPATNTYNQQIILEYDAPPASGLISVNGSLYAILGSPQTISLNSRPANGETSDVTVFFSANPDCVQVFEAVYTAPEPCCEDIRITAVDPVEKEITLTNFGSCSTNVGSYQLCGLFFCSLTSSMQLISGSLDLAAGASTVLRWNSWNPPAGGSDLALYRPSPSYTNPDDLLDFVQWGSGGNGREPVAVNKGIWSAGDFIDDLPPFTFSGGAGDYGLPFWSGSTPPCSITNVEALLQSACDPSTNTYEQDLLIEYISEPSSGSLLVNGVAFPFNPSSTLLTLSNLESDGAPVGVTVSFSEDPGCSQSVSALFVAPNNCFCPSDLNGDGTTDITDFLILLGDFGCSGDCLADLNGGGSTGSEDLLVLLPFLGLDCP